VKTLEQRMATLEALPALITSIIEDHLDRPIEALAKVQQLVQKFMDDASEVDQEAVIPVAAFQGDDLSTDPDPGLCPVLDTVLGETGWYRDPSSGAVAFFGIVQNEWVLEHGPFEEDEFNGFLAAAKHENSGIPLPGTVQVISNVMLVCCVLCLCCLVLS
jgi:hypothetical protein